MLVRGVDRYRHFERETPPAADLDRRRSREHKAVCERQRGDPLPRHRPQAPR